MGEAVALTVIGAADLSPLLAVLAGLEPPAAGEVEWCGLTSIAIQAARTAVARYRLEREQRLLTGYLTPSASLMNNLSLFDNIALPLRYHHGAPPADVSLRVGRLADLLKLGGEVGRRPAGLPRGVRRRAQIARALINEPPLLLLDASFLEVDRESLEIIFSTLQLWRSEKHLTILAATYEPLLIVPLVSRLLVLYRGKLLGSLEGDELKDQGLLKDTTRLLKVLSDKEHG